MRWCDIYEKKEYIETFSSLLYYDINNVAKMNRDYLIFAGMSKCYYQEKVYVKNLYTLFYYPFWITYVELDTPNAK